jgi:hypothetical protein
LIASSCCWRCRSGNPIGPLTPAAQQPPERSITASYNPDLIGQDKLPTGEIVTDLPPIPPLYHIQLRFWSGAIPPAPAAGAPFAEYDWPNPRALVQPERSITASYNLNLIGQDRFPPGEIVYDLAPRAPGQPAQSWTWNYNLNLIGQDQLPVRQSSWPLTDAPIYHVQLRTWFGAVPPTVAAVPFAQYSWPNSRGVVFPVNLGTITASYNINLIGQDRLPFRQQDWPHGRLSVRVHGSSTA